MRRLAAWLFFDAVASCSAASVAQESAALQAVNRVAEQHDAAKAASVHVLELPSALNADLLKCYERLNGAAPWDDTKPHGECTAESTEDVCGAHKATEFAQYSSDVQLHAAAIQRAADNRVDAATADVIWVPFYNMLSLTLRDACGGPTHVARLEMLRAELQQSTALLTRGRHFALALPRTRPSPTHPPPPSPLPPPRMYTANAQAACPG